MKRSFCPATLLLAIAIFAAAMLLAGCLSATPVASTLPTASQPAAPTTVSVASAAPTPAQPASSAVPTVARPTVPVSPTLAANAVAAAVTPAVIPPGWKVYSNSVGFAIAYPAAWSAQAQADSNNGSIHTEALKGPEGEVDLSWGVGFGGACPSGYAVVKVAQGEIQTCYAKNADGTESWGQLSRLLPGAGFSGRAVTSSARLASRDLILQILATLTFAPAPARATAATPAPKYADPFAYCAAVGTIDAPDARYTGPKTPDAVLAAPAGGGAPPPFPEGSVYWRCMDGQVYSCAVGANIPCWDKADTGATASAGMQDFCKAQPDTDVIPAVAAGRETIYAWSCKNGVPVMGKQAHQVDAQGYITDYWQQVTKPAGLANPASQNCAKQGGKLSIEQRGDGGQFGVCLFADNRQCEEWALMRGQCPAGGIKITGYVTPAARYCAITGGQYKVTGNSNTPNEQGTCTFAGGKACDAGDYFDGKCTP